MNEPAFGLTTATRPRQSEEQSYDIRMAKTLVGSLGVDDALRCASRHHWVGLLPLVMMEDAAICRGR